MCHTIYHSFRDCTAFALAQIFKPPMIKIPCQLKLALQNHLEEHNNLLPKCHDYMKCIKSFRNVQRIDYDNYLIILKICLYLEQFELDCELKQHKLLNHKIKESNLYGCYIINVPSMNNENPIVGPDDKVFLTEVLTKNTICARVLKVTKNEVTIQPYFLE